VYKLQFFTFIFVYKLSNRFYVCVNRSVVKQFCLLFFTNFHYILTLDGYIMCFIPQYSIELEAVTYLCTSCLLAAFDDA